MLCSLASASAGAPMARRGRRSGSGLRSPVFRTPRARGLTEREGAIPVTPAACATRLQGGQGLARNRLARASPYGCQNDLHPSPRRVLAPSCLLTAGHWATLHGQELPILIQHHSATSRDRSAWHAWTWRGMAWRGVAWQGRPLSRSETISRCRARHRAPGYAFPAPTSNKDELMRYTPHEARSRPSRLSMCASARSHPLACTGRLGPSALALGAPGAGGARHLRALPGVDAVGVRRVCGGQLLSWGVEGLGGRPEGGPPGRLWGLGRCGCGWRRWWCCWCWCWCWCW